MKMIERQKERVNMLLALIKENPELEIIPLVENDVVGGDEWACWCAKWGNARVDEYYIEDERIYFKSDCDDIRDKIYDELEDDLCKGLTEGQIFELADKKVDELPWEKAIFVRITTP